MALWDWLFGMVKSREDAMQARYQAPSVAPPAAASGPQMTSIRVSVPSTVRPVFGIQTAIELMRSLPVDENPDLVLRVVRKTLRSTGVELEDVIDSAQGQEDALVGGVATDRAAIELLDQQIAVRKANIERLEAELAETRSVRARLQQAMEGETKVGPAIAPEEILKIRAQAAAQAAAPVAPAAPAAPRPAPPVPLKKSLPPKLPLPSAASAPPPAPKSTPSNAPSSSSTSSPSSTSASTVKKEETREPMPSIPNLDEIDDGFEETTAKVEIDARALKKADEAKRDEEG